MLTSPPDLRTGMRTRKASIKMGDGPMGRKTLSYMTLTVLSALKMEKEKGRGQDVKDDRFIYVRGSHPLTNIRAVYFPNKCS